MAILSSVPLFLQSAKFKEVRDQVSFYGHSEIGYLACVIELVKAAFCACTLRSTTAWEHCQNVWTGYKEGLWEFDPKEIHQWKLLIKANLQKQLYLQSQAWEEVLTKCP